MLSKKDIRYLIKALQLVSFNPIWDEELKLYRDLPRDKTLLAGLIARLEKFEKTSPDLPEVIDVSHCDGTRLVQKKAQREGLER